MRTQEEIQAEKEAGQKFIKEHPVSGFGDDNRKMFKIFEKIIEEAQKGKTKDQLQKFIDDEYEVGGDEHKHASCTIEWLFEDGFPIYSE